MNYVGHSLQTRTILLSNILILLSGAMCEAEKVDNGFASLNTTKIQRDASPASQEASLYSNFDPNHLSRPKCAYQHQTFSGTMGGWSLPSYPGAAASLNGTSKNPVFRLLAIRQQTNPSLQSGAMFVATEMAIVHNMLLRGLNSILRQAPCVPDSLQPGSKSQDVSDLLFYVKVWTKTLKHHHDIEEASFFPLVEQETGIVGLMDDLEVEHEEFFDGLLALQTYVDRMIEKPSQYRWATMRTMINSFAPALTNHLYSEIDFLHGLEKFSCEGLRKCWYESERLATKVTDSNSSTMRVSQYSTCPIS